jgi:cytochrome c peroxidase
MGDHVASSESIGPVHGARLVIPLMNPDRGKEIFVSKGCVACHAINGVGGHDAPPMDAHRDMGLVNPFDFAAMMWNHAPAMVAAQEEAFGEQIYFTGHTEHDLTPQAQKMMHHEHGGQPAPAAHAEEVGHKPHKHAPGTPAHND